VNCKNIASDKSEAEKLAMANCEWLFKIDVKSAVKCLEADTKPFTSGSIF